MNPLYELASDAHIINEDWENQYDFHFLGDHELVNNTFELTCDAKLAAITAQSEFDVHFSIQSDALSGNDEIDSHSNLASAAVKAQKAKFRFPKMDPADNVVICTRTPEQKMSDILRIWSQCLTSEETKIWNEISNRDLSIDVSLKSGLRTTKSIIASEIKKFRENNSEKSQLLRTLEKLPEIELPKSDQQLPDQQDIPLSIGPKVNNCLDPDFISSYCTPSPGTKVDQSVNHQQVKQTLILVIFMILVQNKF